MNKYTASVLTAGFCWGFMGFFTRNLTRQGIDSAGAIIVRCGIAAICFAILILVRDRSQLRIKRKDLWCFAGTGIFSLLLFTFCYFHAIELMSLSAAAILLYTAPAIVMLLSAVLFREKITPVKAAAVALSFLGCVLVSGVGSGTALSASGILFGLGSGVGYALYTIFSRYALQRGYSSNTINFYSCLLAAIGAILIWRPAELPGLMTATPQALLWCIATGVISCFIPYLCYTYGLTGLENGKASVLASVEPVVASLVGILLFHEKLTLPAVIGICLVLSAILLLNAKIGKQEQK